MPHRRPVSTCPARPGTPPGSGSANWHARSAQPAPRSLIPCHSPGLSRLDADGVVAGCGPRSRTLKCARSGPPRRLALDAHARRTQSGRIRGDDASVSRVATRTLGEHARPGANCDVGTLGRADSESHGDSRGESPECCARNAGPARERLAQRPPKARPNGRMAARERRPRAGLRVQGGPTSRRIASGDRSTRSPPGVTVE